MVRKFLSMEKLCMRCDAMNTHKSAGSGEVLALAFMVMCWFIFFSQYEIFQLSNFGSVFQIFVFLLKFLFYFWGLGLFQGQTLR